MDEPVCFVPTGKPPKMDEFYLNEGNFVWRGCRSDMAYEDDAGYRKLKPGWLAEAVERVKRLLADDLRYTHPVSASEIRAALFPPSEPTAEQVIGECVVALEALRGTALDAKEIGPDLKAQIVRATEACRAFAKARRAREEKP